MQVKNEKNIKKVASMQTDENSSHQTNNRIVLIHTGGTIGSVADQGVRDVHESGGARIASYLNHTSLKDNRLKDTSSAPICIELREPMSMLSENLNYTHWAALLEAITAAAQTNPSGIIVTHGSDTISYAVVLAAAAFASLPCPVVFVCALAPFDDPASNGKDNLREALTLISERSPGVYFTNRDSAGVMHTMAGACVTEADHRLGNFGEAHPICASATQMPASTASRIFSCEAGPVRTRGTLQTGTVLPLKVFPGLDYRFIHIPDFSDDHQDDTKNGDKPACLVHILYHSGTARCGEDVYALDSFIADHPQVNHYLVGLAPEGEEIYATTKRLIQAGGIALPGWSAEQAIAALNLGLLAE